MHSNMNRKIAQLILATVFISCQPATDKELSHYRFVNDSIKQVYAPDKRVAVYDILLSMEHKKLVLTGETDNAKALEQLKSLLQPGIQIEDRVNMLPDTTVGVHTHALVNNSVANIRSEPRHSGELATQAILGTPLKVLKIQGDFYLVQTPDGYISWVDHGGVTLVNSDKFETWKSAPKIVFTKISGFCYAEPGQEFQKIGDLVQGAQLVMTQDSNGYYKVQYPDGREGYVKKSESEPYVDWISELSPSGALLELYARELLGAPYLWGGTSVKGMDCSGFTKSVYLMNGFIIPRDASQQITAGKIVDKKLDFNGLEKGDLIFFGRKPTDSTKQTVTHVGIWLGNGKGEFIHASGRVKLGSVIPDSPFFDAFNTSRYLGSRRYLGQQDKLLVDLRNSYENQRIKS